MGKWIDRAIESERKREGLKKAKPQDRPVDTRPGLVERVKDPAEREKQT
jgi:hypothetical protein